MWSDWLVFCHCAFSVSALWCPLSAPTIFLGFTWTWGISSWLLQQSAAAASSLGCGVSPHSRRSWSWTGLSPPSHSCTVQPLLIYIVCLLYSFICWWTLSCFHILSVVNNAALNIEVHVSFSIVLLFSSDVYLAMKLLVPCDNSISNLMNLCTNFHSGCTNF